MLRSILERERRASHGVLWKPSRFLRLEHENGRDICCGLSLGALLKQGQVGWLGTDMFSRMLVMIEMTMFMQGCRGWWLGEEDGNEERSDHLTYGSDLCTLICQKYVPWSMLPTQAFTETANLPVPPPPKPHPFL